MKNPGTVAALILCAALLTSPASPRITCMLSRPAFAGDHIEVAKSPSARTSEAGNEEPEAQEQEQAPAPEGQDAGGRFRIEDIPPGRLIEPEPPLLPLPARRRVAVDDKHLSIVGGSGRCRVPTPEEWERVLDALYGRAPVPPEVPPAPPAKPPAPPPPPPSVERPPERPPEAEKPPAEEAVPMPTQEAVSLAFEVGSKGLSKDYARVAVTSGRISGSTGTEVYDIVGDFSLFYRDIVASAGKGRLNQKAEIAELSDDVYLKEPKYELASDELDIRFKQKTLAATKFVQFKKKEKSREPTGTDVPKRQRVINIFKNEPTEVYCNSLDYNWDTEEMEAKGEVKVVQKDFTATMDGLTYNPRTKLYQLSGNVFATLFSTEWIFEHELVEPKDEELARALAEKESTLAADFVEVGEESDLLTMRGSEDKKAELKQEDKYLQADEIVVDDAKKLLTASGNVEFYQENGEWLEKGGLVEPGAEEQLKERLGKPVTSTSDNLSYDYDKRILRQWGGVQLLGENEALLADELTYDEKGKLLHLQGNVAYYRGEDEYVYADEVIIDTDKNSFKFIGIVEGFMYSTEEARKKAEEAKAEAEAAAAQAEAEAEVPAGEAEAQAEAGVPAEAPGEASPETPAPGTPSTPSGS